MSHSCIAAEVMLIKYLCCNNLTLARREAIYSSLARKLPLYPPARSAD
jgi:hypothetical protein